MPLDPATKTYQVPYLLGDPGLNPDGSNVDTSDFDPLFTDMEGGIDAAYRLGRQVPVLVLPSDPSFMEQVTFNNGDDTYTRKEWRGADAGWVDIYTVDLLTGEVSNREAAGAAWTRADITQQNVPLVTEYIATTGYTERGDGGSATYKRVVAEPIHDLKVQSADGAWWEFVPEGNVVYVKQAGGRNYEDCTAAFRSCINYMQYGGGGLSLEIGCAMVIADVIDPIISESIHIGWNTDPAIQRYRGGRITGLANPYTFDGNQPGCAISYTGTSGACFYINQARSLRIEFMHVKGVAEEAIAALDPDNSDDEADWDAALVSAGVTPNARYAPYVGFCIDGFCGTAPSGGYAPYDDSQRAPSWINPTHTTQYGMEGSSMVEFYQCSVRGFEVGVAQTPSDWNNNGDGLTMIGMSFIRNKFSYSAGNTQSRNVVHRDGRVRKCFIYRVTGRHGSQKGEAAGIVSGVEFAEQVVWYAEYPQLVEAGGELVIGCDFESLYKLIKITGFTSQEGRWVMRSCKVKVDHEAKRRYPAAFLEGGDSNAQIIFDDVTFEGYTHGLFFDAKNVTFEPSCRFRAVNKRLDVDEQWSTDHERLAWNASQGGCWPRIDITMPPKPVAVHFNPFDLDDPDPTNSRVLDVVNYSWGGGRFCSRSFCTPILSSPVRRPKNWANGSEHLLRPFLFTEDQVGGSGSIPSASVIRTGRSVTITNNAANLTDREAIYAGYVPGAIVHVISGGPPVTMIVYSVDTATKEIKLQLVTGIRSTGPHPNDDWEMVDGEIGAEGERWIFLHPGVYLPDELLTLQLVQYDSQEGTPTNVVQVKSNNIDRDTADGWGIVAGDTVCNRTQEGLLHEYWPTDRSQVVTVAKNLGAADGTIDFGLNMIATVDWPIEFMFREPFPNLANLPVAS